MESFGYRYNPNYVPDPKFIPGYGGHLPGALTKYGMTYGNMSHQIMRSKPSVAARLAPMHSLNLEGEPDPLKCNCKRGIEYHREGIISNQESMFIPDHVCPGYTGCLTLKKKGVPTDQCCVKILRTLGCDQDPCLYKEVESEDPFPGPPKQILDLTKKNRRCEDGKRKRCCLTLKEKGVPTDQCCVKILRTLGCDQDPCLYEEVESEDPFPRPPKKILDHTKKNRRCKDGMRKRCCLTLKEKGVPTDQCCVKILRTLGCDQDPCLYEEVESEDPFPRPPKQILDHTKKNRRCKDGMRKRCV